MVCKGRLRKCIKMTHLERICLNSGDLQSFVLFHGNLGTQIKHVIGVTWGRWALSQKILEGAMWGGGWCWRILETVLHMSSRPGWGGRRIWCLSWAAISYSWRFCFSFRRADRYLFFWGFLDKTFFTSPPTLVKGKIQFFCFALL